MMVFANHIQMNVGQDVQMAISVMRKPIDVNEKIVRHIKSVVLMNVAKQ
jgi:hypothetical protein